MSPLKSAYGRTREMIRRGPCTTCAMARSLPKTWKQFPSGNEAREPGAIFVALRWSRKTVPPCKKKPYPRNTPSGANGSPPTSESFPLISSRILHKNRCCCAPTYFLVFTHSVGWIAPKHPSYFPPRLAAVESQGPLHHF